MRPSCSSGDCGACTVFKSFVGRSWLSDGEGSDGKWPAQVFAFEDAKKLSSWIHVRSMASTLALRCSVYVIQT